MSTLTSESELYLPSKSKASFKRKIKTSILSWQEAGDKYEWESENFRLVAISGLRRSERIKAQSMCPVD